MNNYKYSESQSFDVLTEKEEFSKCEPGKLKKSFNKLKSERFNGDLSLFEEHLKGLLEK